MLPFSCWLFVEKLDPVLWHFLSLLFPEKSSSLDDVTSRTKKVDNKMFGLGIRNLDFGHLFPAKLEEIKWRTEIRPFKTQTFEIRTFGRSDFKWLGFSYGFSHSSYHSKSGHFCPDFKWTLTKRRPFVRISNGRASRFQGAFKIQTSPDFRTWLYWFKTQTNNN